MALFLLNHKMPLLVSMFLMATCMRSLVLMMRLGFLQNQSLPIPLVLNGLVREFVGQLNLKVLIAVGLLVVGKNMVMR